MSGCSDLRFDYFTLTAFFRQLGVLLFASVHSLSFALFFLIFFISSALYQAVLSNSLPSWTASANKWKGFVTENILLLFLHLDAISTCDWGIAGLVGSHILSYINTGLFLFSPFFAYLLCINWIMNHHNGSQAFWEMWVCAYLCSVSFFLLC